MVSVSTYLMQGTHHTHLYSFAHVFNRALANGMVNTAVGGGIALEFHSTH